MTLKSVMEALPFREVFATGREVGRIKKPCQNAHFVLIIVSKPFNVSKINKIN